MHVLALKPGSEVERMRKVYKKASNKRTAERVRAISLSAEGRPAAEIARILGRHPDTVRKWIKLFNEGGMSKLKYKHTGGRTGKLTGEQEQMLAAWIEEGKGSGGRWTLKALAEKILQEYQIKISRQQILERIIRLGLNGSKSKRRRKVRSMGRSGPARKSD